MESVGTATVPQTGESDAFGELDLAAFRADLFPSASASPQPPLRSVQSDSNLNAEQ